MQIFGIALLLFQAQLGSASGIVTRPGGSEPLGGALVMLNPVVSSQPSRIRTAISEDDGRFTIRDIEPGEYRLQIQSPRFGSAAYGQRKPDGPGTILSIGAGQRISDLKVSMTPTGTIAGRITGRSGEPLAYASVQALKAVYQDGKRVYAMVQSTNTDDRGDYRLFWLTSGKYLVVAGPRSSPIGPGVNRPLRPGETLRPEDMLFRAIRAINEYQFTPDSLLAGSNLTKRILEDGSMQEESWMPTYYPATIDRAQATPVDVTAGATVTGINITLGSSPVQRIRGRVSGFTGQATVALASGTQGTAGRITANGASTIDGSFEFSGVVPGVYFLTAQDRAGGVSTPIAVLVGDRDVEGVSIAIAPAVQLSVRVTAEGLPQGSLETSGFAASLRPELDTMQGVLPPNVRAANMLIRLGNALTFTNLSPGNYQLDISPPGLQDNTKPMYIKSMRLGREDALGTFRIGSDTTDTLQVVLTTESGSVDGVAVGRTGDPAPNTTVVLVPTTARKRLALYQTLVTGNDGRFRFQAIPPGDYKLFAWEDVETGAWANDEFMRAYESRGRAIRVSENTKEEVQLNVITNP
jgi:hypothetical protein